MTALFTVESIIATLMAGFIDSPFLFIPIVFSLLSLGAAVLSIFSLTDSIHFYSKYLEYSYSWLKDVHGIAYQGANQYDKAKGNFRRALEADDVGYCWSKFAFLFFLWFLSAFVLVIAGRPLLKLIAFVIAFVSTTLLAIFTYKNTHHKSMKDATRDFILRNAVFPKKNTKSKGTSADRQST